MKVQIESIDVCKSFSTSTSLETKTRNYAQLMRAEIQHSEIVFTEERYFLLLFAVLRNYHNLSIYVFYLLSSQISQLSYRLTILRMLGQFSKFINFMVEQQI